MTELHEKVIKQETEFERKTPEIIINNDKRVERGDVELVLKKLNNRKGAGSDGQNSIGPFLIFITKPLTCSKPYVLIKFSEYSLINITWAKYKNDSTSTK